MDNLLQKAGGLYEKFKSEGGVKKIADLAKFDKPKISEDREIINYILQQVILYALFGFLFIYFYYHNFINQESENLWNENVNYRLLIKDFYTYNLIYIIILVMYIMGSWLLSKKLFSYDIIINLFLFFGIIGLLFYYYYNKKYKNNEYNFMIYVLIIFLMLIQLWFCHKTKNFSLLLIFIVVIAFFILNVYCEIREWYKKNF